MIPYRDVLSVPIALSAPGSAESSWASVPVFPEDVEGRDLVTNSTHDCLELGLKRLR
jgi:hypothetical protein